MAFLSSLTMSELNEDRKPLHPLFQRTAKPVVINRPPVATQPNGKDLDSTDSQQQRPSFVEHTVSPASKLSPSPLFTPASEDGSNHTSPLEIDPNDGRRKRRKTASPACEEANNGTIGEEKGIETARRSMRDTGNRKPYSFFPDIGVSPEKDTDAFAKLDKGMKTPSKRGRSKEDQKATNLVLNQPQLDPISLEGSSDVSQESSLQLDSTTTQPTDKPKKILKFNPKTGTIGSPPAKRTSAVTDSSTKSTKKKTCMAIVSYGSNVSFSGDFGQKIEQILSSPQKTSTPKKKRGTKVAIRGTPTQSTNLPSNSVKSAPSQPLHPLFLGKAAPKAAPGTPPKSVPKTNIVELTTPKRQPRAQHDARKLGASVVFGGFDGASKMSKTSGAILPAWPWQGMVHIRDAHENVLINASSAARPMEARPRKAKYSATQVLLQEDVLHLFALHMDVEGIRESVKQIDINDWPPPPKSLQLPIKHLICGQEIQEKVNAELYQRISMKKTNDLDEDEIRSFEPRRATTHPACLQVFEKINTSLSAFDVGQCEPQAWAHKYAPKNTSEVLQTGREASILKEWLQSLTVKTVDSGVTGKQSTNRKPEASLRKRKSRKADDFIVSSGDELDDLDELTEPEDDPLSQRNPSFKKTVVRTAGKDSKLKNAVLLSGPHGSGKTAAVYAVAKDLNFEIFEINSSSRRSGKDIMEKVGDMTRNHLVQQHQTTTSTQSGDVVVGQSTKASTDDIHNGRQGTMNAFFKLKEPGKSKAKATTPVTTISSKKQGASQGLPSKAVSKEQKQSLILIEEVDILYDEDKQFWTTVLNLIVTSRRPIIMTCNNEALCPTDFTNFLHAIIRFNTVPVELATDYMLLVAACEGHLIRREAVKELYEGRSLDLRASINELNFWCQFGVGDQKHGGDWYYRRTAGQDLDEHGRQVRVVSEGAYSAGLGWVSEDHIAEESTPLDLEQNVLRELWDGWQLDLGDWNSTLPLAGWASSGSTDASQGLEGLMEYQDFVEYMSASDLCSAGTFAPDHKTQFDTTYPPLPVKALDDYPLGRTPLHSPGRTDYSGDSKNISIYISSMARDLLHKGRCSPALPPHNPDQVKALIRRHTIGIDKDEILTRQSLSLAFDPISYAPSLNTLPSTVSSSSYGLEPAVFDRTLSIITTDVAPYIRGILTYENRLNQQRAERSGMFSSSTGENGKAVKKARMTRSAMSAIEGGTRSTVRRERWFDAHLNGAWVAKTAGNGWTRAMDEEIGRRRVDAIKALQAAAQVREASQILEVTGEEQGNGAQEGTVEQEEKET